MEETLLLNIEVDQSDAQKQLVATEKSLLSLKNEQKELNQAYKEGKISEDSYVKSNLAIQQAIKKETDQKRVLNKLIDTESNSRDAARVKVSQLTREYNSLNLATDAGKARSKELASEIKKLNDELNKGSKSAGSFKDNIGNYPKFFDNIAGSASKAVNEIKPFGVSLDSQAASLGKYATGAGAVVGVLTGLVTMYANSAAGARDLSFAQDLLTSSTSILSEGVAELLGAGNDEIGLFSKLTAAALFYLDSSLGIAAVQQATSKQRLRDLELDRSLSLAQGKIEERNAENARRIRDDESKSLEERLAQTQVVNDALTRGGEGVVKILKEQVTAVIQSTTNFAKNKNAQLEVSQLAQEIADKEEEITGKLTENVTARRNILKLIKEQADFEKQVAAADVRTFFGGVKLDKGNVRQTGALDQQELDVNTDVLKGDTEIADQRLKNEFKLQKELERIRKKGYEDDLANKISFDKLKQQAELSQLDFYAQILGSASSVFAQSSAEYKILATAQTLISTYSAAQKAFESQSAIPIFGPGLGGLAAAAAIASGLANVAAINGVQFAEGGYTGQGAKYEPAGVVHRGEYVTPKHIVESAPAQPHLRALETMRRGYADGGFVTNETVSSSQLAMITANAIRNMPQPVVGVKQIVREMQAVQVKQSTSTL